MKDLSGVLTALITPFRGTEIDEASLRSLVRQQLAGGIKGFVVCGTTAESPTLTDAERRRLFAIVKSEAGEGVTLVLGTGSNDTAQSIAWTKEAGELGADAVLVVAPYYNKPPQRGIVAHFKAIAAASRVPVILYNVPSRTIVRMDVETIAELSRVSNIVGVKEASGDLAFGKQVLDACGPDFLVTSGDDATAFDLALLGAQGVISVASHVMPRQFVDLCARARKKDPSVVAEYRNWLDLVNFLFVEANPIPLKTALWQMGVIASPDLRLPLVQLGELHAAEMKRKLAAAGLVSAGGAR